MRLVNGILHKVFLKIMVLVLKLKPPSVQMVFVGDEGTLQLADYVAASGHKKVLLVTDSILSGLGVQNTFVERLESQDVAVVLFDRVLPDPADNIVVDGLAELRRKGCDALVAVGGGSSIDTAKAVAAAATNNGMANIVGLFKVKQRPLPMYALPTTSGTGSEVTGGAVITNQVSHEKDLVLDPYVVPLAVTLDPALTMGMPKFVTAATGIDALAHAVESYLSSWSNDMSEPLSKMSIAGIFDALPKVFEDGSQKELRQKMSLAAYHAGRAMNISGIGNVHAIAHQLGAKYGIPHGVAIAAVMPAVLDYQLENCTEKLASLAQLCGFTHADKRQQAQLFIQGVSDLIECVGMKCGFADIKPEHIAEMAKQAVKESKQYPVPTLMNQGDCVALLKAIAQRG